MAFVKPEGDIFKFQNAGDQLVGTYTQIKQGVGKLKSAIYTLKTPEGKILKFWGSTVLDDEMAKVKIGDLIQVTYKGQPEGKNYHVYEVLVDDTPKTA